MGLFLPAPFLNPISRFAQIRLFLLHAPCATSGNVRLNYSFLLLSPGLPALTRLDLPCRVAYIHPLLLRLQAQFHPLPSFFCFEEKG